MQNYCGGEGTGYLRYEKVRSHCTYTSPALCIAGGGVGGV